MYIYIYTHTYIYIYHYNRHYVITIGRRKNIFAFEK